MTLKKRNSLTNIEVSIIKKLLSQRKDNRYILGVINNKRGNPELHINSGRISNIKNNEIAKYKNVDPATDEQLSEFISSSKPPEVEDFSNPIDNKFLAKLLPIRSTNPLMINVEESDTIELKETFSKILKYIKTIAAFANNSGGYLIFGIKDENKEIVGINTFFKTLDPALIDQALSYFVPAIRFEKKEYKIMSKDIGIIYVYPNNSKPVMAIRNLDSENIKEGDIYYRYSGETRRIKPAELNYIIDERSKISLQNDFMKLMQNIIKNGIENSAILNVTTGEVEGRSGNFLIENNLLDKIKFIKEGEFVEKSGAPTLKLMGDLHPISAVGTKEIEKSIMDKDILLAFARQEKVSNPIIYIKQIAVDSSKWLPIYYFMNLAKLDDAGVIKYLEGLINDIGRKSYINSTIKLIEKKEIPNKSKNHNTKAADILNKIEYNVDDEVEVAEYLHSIMSLNKEQIDLQFIGRYFEQVIEKYWTTSNNKIKNLIRMAICYLDITFYRT